MMLPRFYCPVEMFPGQTLELPPSIAHHAARVLRLEHGAELILFNGHGGGNSNQLSLISAEMARQS